jgi:hypothetical protein
MSNHITEIEDRYLDKVAGVAAEFIRSQHRPVSTSELLEVLYDTIPVTAEMEKLAELLLLLVRNANITVSSGDEGVVFAWQLQSEIEAS